MISIIVPYRNRREHLDIFLTSLRKIENEYEILIVEQFSDGLNNFNRGKLLNIGALFAKGDHLVMHDVDMVPNFRTYPVIDFAFSNSNPPSFVQQFASSDIQLSDYLGGVTAFDRYAFFDAGGYSNNFFSRAEDNEMMFNLKRNKIKVENKFQFFTRLQHERTGVEFDEELWKKAQLPRAKDDGVQNCNFVLKSTTAVNNGLKFLVQL